MRRLNGQVSKASNSPAMMTKKMEIYLSAREVKRRRTNKAQIQTQTQCMKINTHNTEFIAFQRPPFGITPSSNVLLMLTPAQQYSCTNINICLISRNDTSEYSPHFKNPTRLLNVPKQCSVYHCHIFQGPCHTEDNTLYVSNPIPLCTGCAASYRIQLRRHLDRDVHMPCNHGDWSEMADCSVRSRAEG